MTVCEFGNFRKYPLENFQNSNFSGNFWKVKNFLRVHCSDLNISHSSTYRQFFYVGKLIIMAIIVIIAAVIVLLNAIISRLLALHRFFVHN